MLRSRSAGLAVSRAADGVLVADQGHDAEASTFAVVIEGGDLSKSENSALIRSSLAFPEQAAEKVIRREKHYKPCWD